MVLVERYKYFDVYKLPKVGNRKTRDYKIINNKCIDLGFISYKTSWRDHVFEPIVGTVWSSGCLEDVTSFIKKIKKERKTVSSRRDSE